MPELQDFVAIDWRSGPDRIYFFFKKTDTYSRYDIKEQQLSDNYPSAVKGNWDTFDPHARYLRFGFTTTSFGRNHTFDEDVAWLFFYHANVPMVCKYDQDADKVMGFYEVRNSPWAPILPYFDKIIAGTWWQRVGYKFLFKFLTSDGQCLTFNYMKRTISIEPITYNTMGALADYKDRIITAAQNDRTFEDSHWYIFLTDNQYLVYNISAGYFVGGPYNVESKWPGLSRG